MIEIIDPIIEDNSRSRNRSNHGNGYRRNDRYDNRPNYRRDNFRQNYGKQEYRNRSVSQECDRSEVQI